MDDASTVYGKSNKKKDEFVLLKIAELWRKYAYKTWVHTKDRSRGILIVEYTLSN